MKVLLDTCVWGGAAAVLRSAGHDVEWEAYRRLGLWIEIGPIDAVDGLKRFKARKILLRGFR